MTSMFSEVGVATTQWLISTNLALAVLVLAGYALERALKGRIAPSLRIWLYAPALLRVFFANPLPGIRSWIEQSDRLPTSVDAQWLNVALPAWVYRIHSTSSSPELVTSISASSNASVLTGYEVAFLVYALVAGWLGIKVIRGYLATVRLRHTSIVIRSPKPRPDRSIVDPVPPIDSLISCIPNLSLRLQQQLDAHRIGLCLHPTIGPAAFGITKPMIVLPRDVVHAGKASELEAILAHEIAHLRRKDPLLVMCLNLLCTISWPLLPLWFARTRILALIELAADECALGLASLQERRAYGRLLILFTDMQKNTLKPENPIMTNLISNHHARLHERISSLVSRRAWPRKVQFAVFAGLISATWACTGEGSALQVERDAALPSQESIAETSDANVSSGSTDVEWQPYPPDVVHTQDALRVQLENLPSEASAKRVEILHQLAKIAFEYNHFEEAHPFLTELLALDQESEIAVHSAEMLVDLFTIAWVQPQHALSPDPTADLEKVLNDVQAMPLYASPAGHRLREAVPHLRRGTKWKQALALQASDPRTCATMMDSITTEVPTEQRNSSILSAGLCYADAGEFTIASERLSQLSVPLAADLQEKADALRIRLKSPASSHR